VKNSKQRMALVSDLIVMLTVSIDPQGFRSLKLDSAKTRVAACPAVRFGG